jgi:hypothetical protein
VSDDESMRSPGWGDAERNLLRSAEVLDVPSDAAQGRARARALLTLGAGAAVAAGAAATAKEAALAGASAHPVAGAGAGLGLGKALLVGALGLCVIAGAVVYGMSLRASPHPQGPERSAAPEANVVVVAEQPPAPQQAEAVALPPALPPRDPLASDTRGSSVAVAARAPTAAPAASASLADQVAALDRVRSLSEAGKGSLALVALDEFDRRYPAGALRQEAAVTRVDVLFKLGRGDEGTALANRFLAAYPASSHAEHVRKLVRNATSPSPVP